MEKKVTCVERKYKVKDKSGEYFIVAKTELSEEITGKLLLEDVELKTFLANYDIILSEEPILIVGNHGEEEVLMKEKDGLSKKWMSKDAKIHIIKTELPKEFGMYDFINNLAGKNYSDNEAKNIWKSMIQSLKRKGKVKVIGGTERNKMKYIFIEETEEETGKKVVSEPVVIRRKLSAEENVIKTKDAIREFYRQGKEFTFQELYDITGIDKKKLHYIVNSLHQKEHFIKRVNPDENRNKTRWVKAEAMLAPSEIDKDYMLEKLKEERKLRIEG